MLLRYSLVVILLMCGVYNLVESRVSYYNPKPIIAILSLPCYPQPRPQGAVQYCAHGSGYTSYFSSSYVKSLESAGARVIPLLYNISHTDTLDLLSKVNGV